MFLEIIKIEHVRLFRTCFCLISILLFSIKGIIHSTINYFSAYSGISRKNTEKDKVLVNFHVHRYSNILLEYQDSYTGKIYR
jgi:hypothetical protein